MIAGTWLAATVASSGTTSSAVDLGREYETLLVDIPTTDASTKVAVQASETLGGTYRNVYCTDPADGAENQVLTTALSGNFMWVAPIGGFRYIKIVLDNTQDAERLIRVCGIRS